MRNLNKDYFLKNLNTKYIGKNIIYFKNIDSTTKEARRIIKSEINSGTLILAETQNNGSGRFSREWSSPDGGLWFSIILKLDIDIKYASRVTIIMAAAITKILKGYNIETKIKWPNDILINEKKICGILAEMKNKYIILGTGININIEKNEFPEEIRENATSLKIEFKKEFNKYKILSDILREFEVLYEKFIQNNDLNETINICREKSSVIGKEVNLIIGDKLEKVLCINILDNGNLMVENKEGKNIEVFSGEITSRNKI